MKFHMKLIVSFLKKYRGNKFRGKDIDKEVNRVTGDCDRYTQARAALSGMTSQGAPPACLKVAEKLGLVGSIKRTKDRYGISVFQYVGD
jgi:hypothetical protein